MAPLSFVMEAMGSVKWFGVPVKAAGVKEFGCYGQLKGFPGPIRVVPFTR
jgi:hypothetical protein